MKLDPLDAVTALLAASSDVQDAMDADTEEEAADMIFGGTPPEGEKPPLMVIEERGETVLDRAMGDVNGSIKQTVINVAAAADTPEGCGHMVRAIDDTLDGLVGETVSIAGNTDVTLYVVQVTGPGDERYELPSGVFVRSRTVNVTWQRN